MDFQNSVSTYNTFKSLKVDNKLTEVLNYQFCNLSNNDILEKLQNLRSGINSLESFSHNGLYYKDALIISISKVNINFVNFLLENGSSSRGYYKYPGYPLYFVIDKIFDDIKNNHQKNVDDLIKIMTNLVNNGARFDDYIVHIFWFKLDNIFENVSNDKLKDIKKLYNKSPFSYNKYESYLEIYCQNFIGNHKNKLLEKFLEKYPVKRQSKLFIVKFFSFT